VVEGVGGLEGARVDQLGNRQNLLQPVWRDGKLLREWTFDEVRARAS